MSRAERLLNLMQVLRRYRRPVSGATLAAELDVSLRTLYRDIGALQAQGAEIAGEPGLGYVLKPGFMLPPLMFSAEEIEALALGFRWVRERGDPRLARAATDAMAKISSVLPRDLADAMDGSGLIMALGPPTVPISIDLGQVRQAIRTERKVVLDYVDAKDLRTERTIWPIALTFFEHVRVIVGWCELRQDFRSFRADRIQGLTTTDMRYPRRRQVLIKQWRLAQGIEDRL